MSRGSARANFAVAYQGEPQKHPEQGLGKLRGLDRWKSEARGQRFRRESATTVLGLWPRTAKPCRPERTYDSNDKRMVALVYVQVPRNGSLRITGRFLTYH